MKKYFLSLLAVLAVVVACDKSFEEDVELTVEEVEDLQLNSPMVVDAAAFINNLAADVTDQEIKEFKDTPSSSRVGADGTNWIHVIFFRFGGNNIPLAYLRSDDTDEVCPEAGQVSVLYTLEVAQSGASRLKIEQIDGNGNALPVTYSNIGSSLRANYNTLFGQTINRLSRATANFSGVATGSVPALSTLASNGIDFDCASPVDYTSFYEVTEAPFPLTGFLATMVDGYADMEGWPGGSSANYAATSTSTLEAAIQADIMDGN